MMILTEQGSHVAWFEGNLKVKRVNLKILILSGLFKNQSTTLI